jgi:peptide/nickel transport system substrate-binding protein
MHRRAWLASAALAAAVLLSAASAGAASQPTGTTRATDATGAAAPFARDWARVPSSAAARKAKSVLVFGMEQDVNGFNTNLACCGQYWAQMAAATPVIRGAYVVSNTLAYLPDLATSVVATKKTLTYTIRDDAYWYWGGRKLPVTYRDFVYTWKAFVNPKNDVTSRDGYDQITGFSHKGAKQITFTWSKPYADYHDLFNTVYPAAALKGMDFDKTWANCVCGSDGKPVSDGPFYLSSYTKGQGLTLKANPFWYGDAPGLKQVVFKIITDTNAEIQAMRGGEVDAIQPSPQTALTALQHQSGLSYSTGPGLYQEHLDIQFGAKGQPLLRAPWIRQALMLSVNRSTLIAALFGAVAPSLQPLDSLVAYQADSADYSPDFAKWNYNPAKAIALLREHGCTGGPSKPTDGNTSYFTCAGYPAKFVYTTAAGNQRRETSEQIFTAELAAVGIQVVDNLVPSSVAFGPTVLTASNYDLLEFAWATPPDPGNFVPIWSCEGASNFTKYCNRKATALLDATKSELDPAKRAALFRRADKLIAQDVPSIPLYAVPTILVHKTGLVGIGTSPSLITWNIQDWRWR